MEVEDLAPSIAAKGQQGPWPQCPTVHKIDPVYQHWSLGKKQI